MHAVVLALALLVAPAIAPSAAPGPAPEGCAAASDGASYRCEWSVDTRSRETVRSITPALQRDVPVFPSTLATVTVRLEGEDRGWNLVIAPEPGGEGGGQASVAHHAAPFDGRFFHAETSTHVLRSPDSVPRGLRLSFSDYNVGGADVYGTGPPSMGVFHVTYVATSLPPGEVPSRPAATREDPHLGDAGEDARRPELDVVAAWFDDARVGDGLLDLHLAVANLSRPSFAGSTPATGGMLEWEAVFRKGPEQYRLLWFLGSDGSFSCNLRRDGVTSTTIVAIPECLLDSPRGTMTATFPEGAIGNPQAGTLVSLLSASSFTFEGVRQEEDVATEARYDFTLGGPAEWSALNPRLDPPAPTTLAWYADPLASENLPDTLQVLGAVLATATFLGSMLVLQRTRRQTRRLLELVDQLVRDHGESTREALVALGRLEADFDALYRRGRINESQYQLAASRITSAAARFALRRELGLDDGTPGAEGTRSVRVQQAEAAEREA